MPEKKPFELLLLTTGGTIDGVDLESGEAPTVSASAKWLESQSYISLQVRAVCHKDSREISPSDRVELLREIESYRGLFVLVTHGTFTIAETGSFLKKKVVSLGKPKTVFLVGSWTALEAPGSDGISQLEFALENFLSSAPGVWIAMDKRLWDPEQTEKVEVSPGVFGFRPMSPASSRP